MRSRASASFTSLLRPGTFFTCAAFAKISANRLRWRPLSVHPSRRHPATGLTSRHARAHQDARATDHVPFNLAGIPAFTVIKDFRNYDVRTRHTNADLADAVRIEDLRQAAVFMAVITWQAAMRDKPIPRLKR
jgi:hypothetical protein